MVAYYGFFIVFIYLVHFFLRAVTALIVRLTIENIHSSVTTSDSILLTFDVMLIVLLIF